MSLKIVEASPTTVVSIAANITNGQVAGNNTVLDNATDPRPYAKATLYINGFATAPAANAVIELWMIRQDVDGTSDDTAGSSVTATPSTPSAGFASTEGAELVGSFPLANTTSAQRITRRIAFDGVIKALFFIRNQSGQQINAGSGTECTVKITPYTVAPV
jgi:hypothetical protein